MPPRKKAESSKSVESIKHKDKRANIPTEELRDFVADEEKAPKTLLYPRDPSLDPQLVWKGKDEQDAADLAVPVVPIYIQEKIHPQAIIEDLLARASRPPGGRVSEEAEAYQIELFGDFNGGPPDFEQKVDFYHHAQNWSNRMILGDSLLVMSSLAEKEGLKGKVQCIYLDPPYGIKFGSNWQVSTRKRDVKDGKAEDATRQPEQVRAFRDTWKLGIHSYLAYLRDRLTVARELLTETGSIFVQIGDENVHLVRCVMDEVFGSENFIAQIAFRTTAARAAGFIDSICDHLMWYSKNRESTKYRPILVSRSVETESNYDWIDQGGKVRELEERELWTPQEVLGGKKYALADCSSQGYTETGDFPIEVGGQIFRPSTTRHWATNASGMTRVKAAGRLQVKGANVFYRRYLDDYPVRALPNNWEDTASGGFLKGDSKVYVVQTNVEVVKRAILMTTDPGDLVLDPTCGSGTTAYVAEQWGRRWITCDTSRVALALARTRLMAAKYPYYLLADSLEGTQKEAEITGTLTPALSQRERGHCEEDIKKGFVYKRVPHVTLKSIANNPDIKEGMTRGQIDDAIAKHADVETLFDQPYENKKRLRVSGPFTVESLSPHRVLSTADENQDGTVTEQEARKQQDFAAMILENLKKAGVQNTKKNERLIFDTLEPYAGAWLNAQGTYTETSPSPQPSPARGEGVKKRVAVSIGPEHGTVGPQQVKEAAKEAVQGVGFDLLIVCGFAFDPHVAEEVKRYGKLTVLPAKMNPDLAMGDELLKKTGAGNLFMVFGEPDVEITKQKEGQIIVEIKGVDVYDPTTGQIRSGTAIDEKTGKILHDSRYDIACWFIDTAYNGESFFVRHAYFTGAEEPYEKLKRALRAEIDEAAWSALYSTGSQPFDPPATGKIAVKVINHYGDEVLKVFEVEAVAVGGGY